MTDIVSSVPGIYEALAKLVTEAGNEQSPPVPVFDFEIGQYEPARYITIHEIGGPRYDWEAIPYQQRELYEIHGLTTVFTGDSPTTNPKVATEVLTETFNLHQACVMTVVVSNRKAPFLGTTGPTPQIMLPEEAHYEAGPGVMDGAPSGWVGKLNWSFHFEAILTPA